MWDCQLKKIHSSWRNLNKLTHWSASLIHHEVTMRFWWTTWFFSLFYRYCALKLALQWKSCRLPHVSLSYTTHTRFQVQWHTQAHMKPDTRAHAHTKHTKNDRHTGDTQLGSHTLAGGLQTHRSDHSHTHTHPALPTSVTLLFLYRALSGRGKKNWKTPCWLWFSGVTSPTQNVLVTPESTLCQPVPFWDCTHTQAAISGHWKPAFSGKVKLRWTFIAFKNMSCRESKAVGSGGDRCAWFLSAWEGQILVFMQESSLAEPNKNFVEFSSVTNRDNTNDTTQASCFILSLSQTPFLLTYKKKKHHE